MQLPPRILLRVLPVLLASLVAPAAADAIPSPAPPDARVTITTTPGATASFASGNRAWYNPTAGGGAGETLHVAIDEQAPANGITSTSFPSLGGFFTWIGPTSTSATSADYTWANSAAEPGAQSASATNGSGTTATGFAILADSGAPAGGLLNVPSFALADDVPVSFVAGREPPQFGRLPEFANPGQGISVTPQDDPAPVVFLTPTSAAYSGVATDATFGSVAIGTVTYDSSHNSMTRIVATKFAPDWQLDPSIDDGTDGVVDGARVLRPVVVPPPVAPATYQYDSASAVAILPGGEVVAAGDRYSVTTPNTVSARLPLLDSFSSTGVETANTTISALGPGTFTAIVPSGSGVVAASEAQAGATDGSAHIARLVRASSTWSLASSFASGTGGSVRISGANPAFHVHVVHLQGTSTGGYLVAGTITPDLASATSSSIESFVLRLTSAGVLDPAFNSGAPRILSQPGGPVQLRGALLDANGRITVSLTRPNAAGSSTLPEIKRLLPDGSLDPSFGTGGVSVFDNLEGGTPGPITQSTDGTMLTTLNYNSLTAIVRIGQYGSLEHQSDSDAAFVPGLRPLGFVIRGDEVDLMGLGGLGGFAVTPYRNFGASGVAKVQLDRASAPVTSTGCSSSFSSPSPVATNPSGSTVHDTGLSAASCYRYQLTTTDHVGNASTVISTTTLRVGHLPTAAGLVSPSTGAVVNANGITLTASFADPDGGDTGRLEFQACGDPECGHLLLSGSSPDGIAIGDAGSWTLPVALDEGGSFAWRARGVDSHGLTGPWSTPSTFTTLPPNTNTAPPVDHSGSETLVGGIHNDDVDLGNGNDTYSAGIGDDTIHGGRGDDLLRGDEGDDALFGEAGNDVLVGGLGDDLLGGGTGDDQLSGGSGRDYLLGSDGNDQLDGGSDDDRLVGGPGADTISGGSGDDIIIGNAGADSMSGGAGADRIDARDSNGSTSYRLHARGGWLAATIDLAKRTAPDVVRCGPGKDRVRADANDIVAKDCEKVQRPRIKLIR